MPKVVVYVPAADARVLEDRFGDLAGWVRGQLRRAMALELGREPPPGDGGGVREPRRPRPGLDSGSAVVELPSETPASEEAEAVSPDREARFAEKVAEAKQLLAEPADSTFRPDFKPAKDKKGRR